MNISRRTLLKWSALALSIRPSHGQAFDSGLAKLRRTFRGEIIRPGDAAYETARRVASFNPTTDRHPQLIARCAEEEDIVRAVLFARDHSLEVAVRAGGFDVLGASASDGMVIALSPMKQITVDHKRRIARLQSGVRASELASAVEGNGLAAALGCHPAIGVTGLTLGGGLGWLAGKHGASCDNVIQANIVSAEGKVFRASATENPDLFWAIKGGGGNFGIVSSLEVQLHAVDQVFGGPAAYRGDLAAFLRFYRDFMKDAPDRLTVELSIRMLGQPTLVATACWSGNVAEGERVLRPLREFGPPLADGVRVVGYGHLIDRPGPEFGRRLFGDNAPPPPAEIGPVQDYWRGGSLDELSDGAAAQIAAAVESAPAGWSIGLGHYIHGQAARATEAESPLPRRRGQLTYFFDANWRNPEHGNEAMDWVNQSQAAMQRYASKGTYVDYLSSNSPEVVEASYGRSYARLSAIKRQYDPDNFFHRNRNVVPRSSVT